MNPDQSQNRESKPPATGKNSGPVTRRAALGMAFQQAFSAYKEAKKKAIKAVSETGAKRNKVSGTCDSPPDSSPRS